MDNMDSVLELQTLSADTDAECTQEEEAGVGASTLSLILCDDDFPLGL